MPIRARKRTETRPLRPILGLEAAQAVLADAVLRIGVSEVGVEDPAFRCSPIELLETTLALEPRITDGVLDEAAAGLGVPLSALGIVATARSPFLKQSAVLAIHLATDLDATTCFELGGQDRPAPLQAIHTGFEVTIALILLTPQTRERLKPWRRGTIITAATFSVLTEPEGGFQPIPLDDETRAALRVPRGTSRFVRHIGPSWSCEQPADCVEVHVDSQVLGLMSKGSMTRRDMQRELIAFVYASVVTHAAGDPDLPDHWSPSVECSVLGQLLQRAAEGSGATARDLFDAMTDELERVVAHIDAMVDLRASIANVLKGGRAAG